MVWFCARTGRVGQAQYKFCISALPRFQCYVFSVFMPAKKRNAEARADSSPDPSSARAKSKIPAEKISRGFANPFPRKLFRKTESAICIRTFRPFPLEKLCASHRGALAHGCAIVWIFSRIFDKVSSSGIVKTLIE